MSVLLLAALLAQDDKAAAELMKKLADRVANAKSLHIKATLSESHRDSILELKMKGPRFVARIQEGREQAIDVKCDGKRFQVKGRLPVRGSESPDVMATVFRRAGSEALGTAFLLFFEFTEEPLSEGLPSMHAIKWEGTEKVGDVEAAIVSYELRFREAPLQTKAWIDPAKLTVLKRELSLEGDPFVERFDVFAYDVEMPDDDFAFQSAASLVAGRAQQVARSVELFMRYTGHAPRALGELTKRPEWLDKDIFWPECGFWLGGAMPAVAYSVDGVTAKVGGRAVGPADRRPIAGVSERLAKQFNDRVRIALVAAGVEAFRVTYSALPRKKADLWQKPEGAVVWPDGGFVPEPADLRVITDTDDVRVMVTDWRERTIKPTHEERLALEAGATTRLTAAEAKELEAHIDGLRDDDLEVREKASARLAAWGAAVAELLDRRMRTEKDAEALARFREMQSRLRVPVPGWQVELGPLMQRVRATPPPSTDAACTSRLSMLWLMQANYMAQFGGRAKLMPSKTGRDFWLELSRTKPPLIDPSSEDFVCPGSSLTEGCTYWGPSGDVNTYGDGDPVGMCDDPSHGGQVLILRKSADVLLVLRTDPLYTLATKKLKKD